MVNEKRAIIPVTLLVVWVFACVYSVFGIYTKMNHQTWDVHVDDVSMADYKKLVPLVEAMYTTAVEVDRFCRGCEIAHPSQREHDCLMMSEEERWEVYCDIAVDIVNDGMILEQFIEALRISRRFHQDALESLRQLQDAYVYIIYALAITS